MVAINGLFALADCVELLADDSYLIECNFSRVIQLARPLCYYRFSDSVDGTRRARRFAREKAAIFFFCFLFLEWRFMLSFVVARDRCLLTMRLLGNIERTICN